MPKAAKRPKLQSKKDIGHKCKGLILQCLYCMKKEIITILCDECKERHVLDVHPSERLKKS